jgi:APA family basic amino acid/polyamine antiporter
VILIIATNAGLIGLSRLTFSMGQYRQLPDALRQVHPRFNTPYVAIIVFSGVAALTMLPGETDFLATMYSFGAMLSFTIAHISVVRLRKRQPLEARHEKRRWKPALNFRFRGTELPLTAVFGGLGTFAAWIVVMALNLETLVAGAVWMLLGTAIYFLFRRRQGLPLKQTVKVETLAPLGVEEVEYRSVLIAFEQEPFSEGTVLTARTLAARRRRAIHVLALINVPTHLPLDAELPAEEGEAREKIERAKLICGQRASGTVLRVRPGQAGQAIVQRARELRAAAIVMQLRYRNGAPLYGKTLQTVLAERPCRVIVAAEPGDAAASRGRVSAFPSRGRARAGARVET